MRRAASAIRHRIRNRQPINWWLVTSVILLGVTLTAVAIYQQRAIRDNIIINERRTTTALVQRLSSSVASELQQARDTLETIASVKAIALSEPSVCQEEFERIYSKLDTSFVNLSRINNETGVIDCDTAQSKVGNPIAQKPYLLQILNDPQHQSVLGSVSTSYNREEQFVELQVPFFDQASSFGGTIGSTLLLSDLEEKLNREYELDRRGTIALIDVNGDIIFHNRTNIIGKNLFDEELFSNAASSSIKSLITEDSLQKSGEVHLADNSSLSYSVANVFPERDWLLVGILDDETAIDLSLAQSPLLNWVRISPWVLGLSAIMLSVAIALVVNVEERHY